MSLTLAATLMLAQQCAPEIAPEALLPVLRTESGFDPLKINVNGGPRVTARSAQDGAAIVRRYVAAGYSVDVGLAQINSRNFSWLGLSEETAFEPCTNLQAASRVLQDGYARASRSYSGLDAISVTYSLYNTGSQTRGFANGYVGRVWRAADRLLARPEMAAGTTTPASGPVSRSPTTPALAIAALSAPPATWVVGDTQSNVLVFK